MHAPAPAPAPVDLSQRLQHLIDHKTKPLGSLGRLESLALQLGLIQGREQVELVQPQMVVFAGDHGLAARGVSAFPSDVTWQMVENFLAGGAAVSVLARQHGLALTVVDAGVAKDIAPRDGLQIRKIAPGTADASQGPAMTLAQCQAALNAGAEVVRSLPGNAVLLGEMGIGNTSSAALIMSRLLDLPLSQCVGRGTGLDDDGLQRKLAVLMQALEANEAATEPLAGARGIRWLRGGHAVWRGAGGGHAEPGHRGGWFHRHQCGAGGSSLAARRAGSMRVFAPVGRERACAAAEPPGRAALAAPGLAPGRGLGGGAGLAPRGVGGAHPQRHGQLRVSWRERAGALRWSCRKSGCS